MTDPKRHSMRKNLAHIITGSRVVCSLLLLFPPLSSAWFYTLYLLCGLGDMIDGTVARRMGSAGDFGAKLDTVADLVFLLVCSVKLLPLMHIPLWLWVWTVLIALTKILNIAVFLIREKKLLSVHSVLNKITGLALFLLPLSPAFVPTDDSVATVCVLATVAVIQEVCLIAKGQEVL